MCERKPVSICTQLGYTAGIEKLFRAYGLTYSLVDSRALLFAHPLAERGVFSPVRCDTSFALFAGELCRPQNEYGSSPRYRNQNRDIAFEREPAELTGFINVDGGRVPSPYKYWANEAETYYDPKAARAQAKADAKVFFDARHARLQQAAKICPHSDLSLVSVMTLPSLGQLWHEGNTWLEALIARAGKSSVTLTSPNRLLSNLTSLQQLTPYPCAAESSGGYGEDLLNHSNSYLLRYARKAAERMIDLAERFPAAQGINARILNVAAREVLLSQAIDWPQMLSDRRFPEYADMRFTESINAFTTVFESLGAHTMNPEWLTSYEKKHPLFPWMNYHLFAKKK